MDLNPNAPVYIPSPHPHPLNDVDICHAYNSSPDFALSVHLPYHPQLMQQPLYSVFDHQNQYSSLFCASSPMSYSEICYYVPPPALYIAPWKEVLCSPDTVPTMTPFQLSSHHQRATLTLLSDEKEAKEKPQENGVLVGTMETKEEDGDMEASFKVKVDGYNKQSFNKACKGFTESGVGPSFGRRKVFVPKVRSWRRCVQTIDLSKRKDSREFEFKKMEVSAGKTTVMIRNLPNKFTKQKLLSILDQHCSVENKKLNKEGSVDLSCKVDVGEEAPILSEYDFVYLPIDFQSGSNKGYAFVNFTSAVAAWRLYNFLHNYDWKAHGSHKVCEVTYARIQGKDALVQHFRNSSFPCARKDYLPVSFKPSRNGNCETSQEFIGKMIGLGRSDTFA